MAIRTRYELECENCSRRRILAATVRDKLSAVLPKGWRTVRWDMYDNCSHYCSVSCERAGRERVAVELADPDPSAAG